MNTSGEVADMMVKEGIQITESAVKLAGLGAKNLAAIIIAMMSDKTKMQGKTNLKQLLKAEKPLCILQIKEADLKKFNAEAKKYGVLFTAVTDKTNDTGLCDVIAKQEDVTKLNYIMEKLGYTAPVQEEKSEQTDKQDKTADKDVSAEKAKAEPEKNASPRAVKSQSEHRYTRRGDTERAGRNTKESVRDRINNTKSQPSLYRRPRNRSRDKATRERRGSR